MGIHKEERSISRLTRAAGRRGVDVQGTLDVDDGSGTLTGDRYVESLRDGREVWLDGQKVDVSTHPAFAGVTRELARLYDMQHSPEYRDQMTFVSPSTGNRVSFSYLLPTTPEELTAKAANSNLWMKETWGQMGRLSDFCANFLVGFWDYREELGKVDPRFKVNVEAYHRYAQENDLVLTHALGDPQIDRSSSPTQDPDLALRVVEEDGDGIVVRGAKQLSTLAPLAQEALVYLSASFALREEEQFVQWFAIPINAPGLKVVCREPLSPRSNGYGHFFSSRFDEQDALLIFDDVRVPWERVFLLRDGRTALAGLARSSPWAVMSTNYRFYQRMLTTVGVASMMAEAIGVDGFKEVRDRLGEMVTYLEIFRLAIAGTMASPRLTPSGLVAPSGSAATGTYAAQISSRMAELLRQVGTSGIVMQPSERDLANPELRPYLEKYMRGRNMGVEEKSRLFRLAWDLAGDSYGQRQELYEYLHRGDLTRNRSNLYAAFDRSEINDRIRKVISQPLPHGEPLG